MKIFISLIAITIIFTALAGIFSLNMGHAMNAMCPISLLFNGNCPSTDDALAVTEHHISGILKTTQSVLYTQILLFALGFIFSIFSSLFIVSKKENILPVIITFQETLFTIKNQMLQWLEFISNKYPRTILLGASR